MHGYMFPLFPAPFLDCRLTSPLFRSNPKNSFMVEWSFSCTSNLSFMCHYGSDFCSNHSGLWRLVLSAGMSVTRAATVLCTLYNLVQTPIYWPTTVLTSFLQWMFVFLHAIIHRKVMGFSPSRAIPHGSCKVHSWPPRSATSCCTTEQAFWGLLWERY